MYDSDFRRCLEECDIIGIRRLWQEVQPNLPQPESEHDVLVTLHHARTQASSIGIKQRAYSHRWLIDNGYPSGLPDELRPKAERLYPRRISVIGIATRTRSPLALAIRGAMEQAVLESYEDGMTEPGFVRGRMLEARQKVLRS